MSSTPVAVVSDLWGYLLSVSWQKLRFTDADTGKMRLYARPPVSDASSGASFPLPSLLCQSQPRSQSVVSTLVFIGCKPATIESYATLCHSPVNILGLGIGLGLGVRILQVIYWYAVNYTMPPTHFLHEEMMIANYLFICPNVNNQLWLCVCVLLS